jgi:hypothetical protein
MGPAWRNALSTLHRTGGPPGTICSGTACTTWTGPSGGASTGLHTWGSASCATMQVGIGVDDASCAGLMLLRSAHRLSRRRFRSSRRGLSRGSHSLFSAAPLSSNG